MRSIQILVSVKKDGLGECKLLFRGRRGRWANRFDPIDSDSLSFQWFPSTVESTGFFFADSEDCRTSWWIRIGAAGGRSVASRHFQLRAPGPTAGRAGDLQVRPAPLH